MGAPPPKKRREDRETPTASTSTAGNVVKAPDSIPPWSSILSGIQGQRGEPGGIESLNALCRVISLQGSTSNAKKSVNEPSFRVWTDFLAYWQDDPGLKDVATIWEQGDQSNNNSLTIASLRVYTSFLNAACSPHSGLIAVDSQFQGALARLLQELTALLHFLQKYLNAPGKNDLATASLELVGALLRLARHSSARNATSRKIWDALNLEARVICRLLGTTRKFPLQTKHGRKPDIRHLMINVLVNLLSPTSSMAMKVDILSQKGISAALFKGLSEDPYEIVEAVLDTVARLCALDRLALDTRCRLAEDSWPEAIKLYARQDVEGTAADDFGSKIYSPATTTHRYLLFLATALVSTSTTLVPSQRKALGGLIGMLQISDSFEQAEVAAHILSSAPDLMPSFWTKFAPSLEPRLSSKWVTGVAFATRVVSSPLHTSFLALSSLPDAQHKSQSQSRPPHSVGFMLDTALMPSNLGKVWMSKALQQSDKVPLVSYLTCQFLQAGLQKCVKIIESGHRVADDLAARGDTAAASVWRVWASKFASDASDRLPDLQVLIALVQKTLGRAFSRASSVVSVASTETPSATDSTDLTEEDSTLVVSLTVRTIELYRQVAPQIFTSLRFDFGKLLDSPFFASAAESTNPMAAIGQSALLRLISLPANSRTGDGAITWAWSKSSDGGLSPVASIIHIYLTSRVSSLKSTAQSAVQGLLGSAFVFENMADQVPIWLDSLPRGREELDVLVFFDKCLQRCLQTPYKYADQIAEITSTHTNSCTNAGCHQVSPLLATLHEQVIYRLGLAEPAVVYVTYLLGLVLRLACYGQCRCLLPNMVSRLANDAEPFKETQGAVIVTLKDYQLMNAGLFGQPTLPRKMNGQYDENSLESMLCLCGPAANGQLLVSKIYQALSKGNRSQKQSVVHFAGYMLAYGRDIGNVLIKPEAIAGRTLMEWQSQLSSVLQLSDLPELFRSRLLSAKDSTSLEAFLAVLEAFAGSESSLHTVLQPYTDILAVQAEASCHGTLQAMSSAQLLKLSARLLNASSNDDIRASMTLVFQMLQARVCEANVSSYLKECGLKLYAADLEAGDDLLAAWLEQVLPTGFIHSSLAHSPRADISVRVRPEIPSRLLQAVLSKPARSSGAARMLAVLAYRLPTARSMEGLKGLTLATHPDTSSTCLAYLTVLSLDESKAGADFKSIDAAFLQPALLALNSTQLPLQEERLYGIILAIARLGVVFASHVAHHVTESLCKQSITTSSQSHSRRMSFLADLHSIVGSAESLNALETFVHPCLLWIVRRFAEDEVNDVSTTALITNLSEALVRFSGKWLLRPHLVEPVFTAALQNRLNDGQSLEFISALINECKLQDTVYVAGLQSMSASRQFRLNVQPGNALRKVTVEVLVAISSHSPLVVFNSNILPVLLAYYTGTTHPEDRMLLGIFKRVEQRRALSLRDMVKDWVPWTLRGTCSNLFQVLGAIDSEVIRRSCALVLRGASHSRTIDSDRTVGAPEFYLAVLSVLLEQHDMSRSNWLVLVSSNLLGLAICALASHRKDSSIAGDRILAKARNALQSSEMREADEIVFVLDCARNAIESSKATSTSAFPGMMALLLTDALHGLTVPESLMYPATWKWLLGRATLDTTEVPLFYSLLYSTSDEPEPGMDWLLDILENGVNSAEDWRTVRRRQVVDLLLSYIQSGVARNTAGMTCRILRMLVSLTTIPQAAHDLTTKSGFLSVLAMQEHADTNEKIAKIDLLQNIVTLIQPSKLRRARNSLWMVESLQALDTAWSNDLPLSATSAVCDVLRRCSAHLTASTGTEAIEACKVLVCVQLDRVSQKLAQTKSPSNKAIADVYDAVLRLGDHCSTELFERATTLALVSGLGAVREQLIRTWQRC